MIRTEHREEKWIFPFVEYAPTDKKGGLPLIIQLHGAGERGNGQEALSLVDVHGFSKLIADKEIPCIFAMPQCPKGSFWAARVESIIAFIDQLIEEYNIDTNRIYLTGLSMGGYGTWFTAMARPDLFAAIAPVCGGGMAWNAPALKKLPIWAFHGACDNSVSTTQSDEMVEKLRSVGANVKYTRMDGVGHNVWIYAYVQELLDWLLSHSK